MITSRITQNQIVTKILIHIYIEELLIPIIELLVKEM